MDGPHDHVGVVAVHGVEILAHKGGIEIAMDCAQPLAERDLALDPLDDGPRCGGTTSPARAARRARGRAACVADVVSCESTRHIVVVASSELARDLRVPLPLLLHVVERTVDHLQLPLWNVLAIPLSERLASSDIAAGESRDLARLPTPPPPGGAPGGAARQAVVPLAIVTGPDLGDRVPNIDGRLGQMAFA